MRKIERVVLMALVLLVGSFTPSLAHGVLSVEPRSWEDCLESIKGRKVVFKDQNHVIVEIAYNRSGKSLHVFYAQCMKSNSRIRYDATYTTFMN